MTNKLDKYTHLDKIEILDSLIKLEIRIKKKKRVNRGLCSELLYHNDIENWRQIYGYIHENKPFFAFIHYPYFWRKNKVKPRLKWLRKHIEILSNSIENDNRKK